MESTMVGMQQGVQAANEMINAPAEQSLLSSRAQEAQLNLQEHKQSYAANMAVYSAQQKYAANNHNTDLMTYQGTIQMLDQMAKDPSIASQPKAMDEIRTRKLEAQNGMAKSASDKLKTEADQIEMVGNAVNQAMLSPEDPASWKMAMEAAPPEMKDNLMKAQAYFNGPDYAKLDDLGKQLKQQEVSGHFATGKMIARSNNDVSKVIESQNAAIAKQQEDAIKNHQKDQDIAARQQKIDKATDNTNKQVLETDRYNAARNRLEDQLTKLQDESPTIKGDVPGTLWGTNKADVVNPAIAKKQKQMNDLDKAHEENMKRLGTEVQDKSEVNSAGKVSSSKGEGTALPEGVKLPPGIHTDGNGNSIEVFKDGTYKDVPKEAKTTKAPSEPPPGSELIGHTPEGKEVYKDKNGKQWVK
jgi:hypothetical protein